MILNSKNRPTAQPLIPSDGWSTLGRVQLCWWVALVCCLLPVGNLHAAEGEPLSPEENSEQKEAKDTVLPIYELGSFHVRQHRPTRGQTVNVRFELHYRVSKDSSDPKLEHRLTYWTHRLRDQVITSVRHAELRDFTEPGLIRLQQLIRLRIDRVLKFARIEHVFITRYEYLLE